MAIVDDHGRLFGRLNLVDAAVAAFVLLLVPLGYGTYLLFQPSAPRIDSVAPSIISREERRIGVGGYLRAKFKVRGTGFTPLLRARIGDAEALGFVFENPNSADILVGPVPPGAHDLILLDGIQEVARAIGAISVQPEASTFVRAVGWLTNLDADLVKTLRVGLSFPEIEPAFEILALGPTRPARSSVKLAGSTILRTVDGREEREAVLTLRCDPSQDNPCTIGERAENQIPPVSISLTGPSRAFQFSIEELLPPTPPQMGSVQVRLAAGAPLSTVRVDDRDGLLDERRAVVTAINRSAGGATVTLNLGLDESRDGWWYRGQPVRAGAPFRFSTNTYEVAGTIESVRLPEPPAGRAP